ncbi:MAG TPA: protein kinase [Burkholderiales bacterium]|nr:protein kinase [Burkholderiales bacterium]
MAALPEKIGKYEIQGVLGKGAMGTVYKAYDRAIARAVAIKAIVKASLPADELKHVLSRFRHEAQAVGRINHPRIVQIYEYGEDDEIAYIVMELVNGKTLAQHLAQETHYSVREAGEIIRQILDGIGYAHTQGVVHRDMKPSNIMINDDGRIKISDFGIAHIEASELTQIGDVLGTPYYMPPEQFLGGEIDALADLYSVGVIAYELLTGKKPFTGNTATLMQTVLHQPPPNPSQLNPKLSPLIDRVLQRALAKKREERFQSAREFADALREAVDATLSVGAAPPAPAPDSAALLDAARLLNLGAAKAASVDNVQPVLTGDSAISIDTGVRQARLLFIDDEERILTALKSLFKARYHVFATTDPDKALDFISKYQMHVIISDQRMPQMQGVELLRRARDISPHSVRILLTGYSDLTAIVGSINDGEVYRFISKPWDNTELHTIIAEAATIARELANARPTAVALPKNMDAGVLVIDKDEGIARVVREVIGGRCPVLFAAGLDDALAAMQAHEIAVVIVDVDTAQQQLTAMLKLLKEENPRILTMVITTASDSELMIELINQAQIFRFLNKPVNVKLLKGHLDGALQRYLTYRQAPELAATQHVEPAAEVRASSLGQRILGMLKSLRTS